MGAATRREMLLNTMMEGYSNSSMPMPPLSQIPHSPSSSSSIKPSQPIAETQMGNAANTSRKRARKLGAVASSESLKTERDRRLKMTQMFAQLQATVPGVFPKATKEVIINETIEYIKELEKKKQRLEELKESMKPVEGKLMLPCTTNRNCSITVTVSGNVAFFGIQSVARHGLITLILKVFSKHQAEVLAANVAVNQGKLILAITAVLQNCDGEATVEVIKREIMSL